MKPRDPSTMTDDELAEHVKNYRKLKPEFVSILKRVGPERYAAATAHLHFQAKKPAKPRFARM